MPLSLLALAAGAFGIGTTEFIIMGLLTQVGADLGISIPVAGTLISGYAIGVAVGAPLLTIATRHWPRKQLLMALMLIFIAGNAAAALARGYGWLMGARVLTSLTHGTFFGVGRLADKGVMQALAGSIGALLVTLALGCWAFGQAGVAMSDAVLLGTVAFATVAPMQMRLLQQAGPDGANLASSLNISAFNLGNALGAWVGGLVLSHGFGLLALGGRRRA